MADEGIKRSTSEVFSDDRAIEVSSLAQKVFGREPKRIAFPGGTSRSAFIADMDEALYVFAKRENKNDAQVEGIVLRTLGASGHVPNLKAVIDDWVVQEHIEGIRLPILLDQTPEMADREAIVATSLDSLAHIHEDAHKAGLQHRIPKLGVVDKWLWNRTGAAKRVSHSLGIDEPNLDREKLVGIMSVKRDEFVKWDARPGNAMISDGRAIWFDWEDCGRSKALEDLAFVLCDEWTALDADAETRLMNKYLPFFNRSMTQARAEHYIRLFGVTHMMLRLRMAEKLHTRDNKWWDRDYCLQGDKIGVTKAEVTRTLTRAKRWADGVDEWQPLLPWLDKVAIHYEIAL